MADTYRDRLVTSKITLGAVNNTRAIPIKYRPVSCGGGSVGRAKKKKSEWTLEGVWLPEKAALLSKKAWLKSQLENVVFSFVNRSIDVN